MSTQKVRKISKRSLNYTATWASGLLTVNTPTHFLATGNKVSLFFADSPQDLIDASIIVTTATQFTIPVSYANRVQLVGRVEIGHLNTGMTGGQEWFSIPRGQGSGPCVIQSFVTGTGGATYTLELSLNLTNPILAVSTVTHSIVDGNPQFITVDPAWAYGRINPSVIGAATTLTVLISG